MQVASNVKPMRVVRYIHGFTMVELIMTMVVVGILAAVAMPRFFDSNVFQSRGFKDQMQATLRHAQKLAIAQHRFVCVSVEAGSVTLTYDANVPGEGHATATCPGSQLTSPAGLSPYTLVAPAGITISGVGSFNFNHEGRASAAQSLLVSGYATPVIVEAETGYVH